MTPRVPRSAAILLASATFAAFTTVHDAADAEVSSAAGPCTATWQNTAVPLRAPSEYIFLRAMSGTSSTDLYVVGDSYWPGPDSVRAWRSTGSGWVDLTMPNLDEGSSLTDATSAVPGEAWFGGFTGASSPSASQPVLLHTVGSSVSRVPLPAAPIDSSGQVDQLVGLPVDATGDGGVWVGASYYPKGWTGVEPLQNLLYRRTAAGNWAKTQLPTQAVAIDALTSTEGYFGGHGGLYRYAGGTVRMVPLPAGTRIEEISSWSPSDVWARGWIGNESVLWHFDGTSWTSVAVPPTTSGGAKLNLSRMSVAPNGVLWLTGDTSRDPWGGFTLRYDPGTQTWASVFSSLTVQGYQEGDLHALSGGDIFLAGVQQGLDGPVGVGRLCQLTARRWSLAPSAVAVNELGDGVLVTGGKAITSPVTVTDRTGAVSTGPLKPEQGGSLRPFAAGTYRVTAQPTGYSATVLVPVQISPPVATLGCSCTRAVVYVATRPAPAGFAYRLQVKWPGATSWEDISLDADTRASRTFTSAEGPVGEYAVRAKLRGPTAATDWSPVTRFTLWTPAG